MMYLYLWGSILFFENNVRFKMIKRSLPLFFLFIFTSSVFSQGTWTKKADFGGGLRYFTVGFSIGKKGYIGTGIDNSSNLHQDFWEWDQATNTWTQKADFGGPGRHYAVGFSIGSKGYIGTGWGTSYGKDFWEFDPVANTWTQKTDFGGTGRLLAKGFSIGTKGYIGTGTTGAATKDFWEWDQAGNTWTQKADFGGGNRVDCIGFSIGNYGYMGTGYFVSTYFKDFWKYDPVANTWTKKADFGGTARGEATGFSIGNYGYIGFGTIAIGSGTVSDFWEYDPVTDTWKQVSSFAAGLREEAVGFSIGCKGYVGAGLTNDSAPFYKDFWEYTPSWICSSLSAFFIVNSPCLGDSTVFTDQSTGGATSWSWNFGDPGSGTANTSSLQNPKHLYTAAGTYAVKLIVSDGTTQDSITKNVVVSSYPVANAGPDTSTCPGVGVQLNATGGGTYLWSPAGTLSNAAIANPIAAPLSGPVTYAVIVSNGACADTDSVVVSVLPAPLVAMFGEDTICVGDNDTLAASGGGTYSWFNGAPTAQTVVSPAVGNYYFSVTVSNGQCSTTDSFAVTVLPKPVPVVTCNTDLCAGDSASLLAAGGGTYSWWSNGATSAATSVLPPVGTTYYVVSVSLGNCTATDSVAATVGAMPVADAGLDTGLCPGSAVSLLASGGNGYSWFPSAGLSNNNIKNPDATPLITTTYHVIAFIGNCTDTDSVKVTIYPPATGDAVPDDTTIFRGTSIGLSASGGKSYSWYPPVGLNNSSSASPTATPDSTTMYYVVITDSNGCSTLDSVLIRVDITCNDIFIPNAFSPNGDGQNDSLLVRGACINVFSLYIYNRWGEEVFHATDPEQGWDGIFKGQALEPNIFVFYLNATLLNNTVIAKKGNINLVR